ncbi:MAG: hypothetical protein ACTHKZ_03025 [Lysobacteraceae bacterium]
MSTSDSRTPQASPPQAGSGTAFLVVGLVFLALGAGRHLAVFLAIGAAFVAIGASFLARARKAGRGPRH